MNLLLLLLTIACVALVAAAIGRGIALLRAGQDADRSVDEDREIALLDELLAEKARLFDLMRSVDLDLSMSKISEADHKRTMRRLERDASYVLRQLDAVRGTAEDLGDAERLVQAHTSAIEAAVREDGAWSSAALLRHGGRPPQPVEEGR